MASGWRDEHRLTQAADAQRLAASASSPSSAARAARLQAEAALQQGDVPAAERAVARALRAAPNDWSLYRDQAVLLQRLGDRPGARGAIGRALGLNPRMVLPSGFSRPFSEQP